MPSAAQIPQNVILFGNLIIDNDYTFAPGSNIVVAGYNTIKVMEFIKFSVLGNSTIKGCENMWRGLVINYGGAIELKTVTVEDAFIGVSMGIINMSGANVTGSDMTIKNCTFNLCRTGISMGDEVDEPFSPLRNIRIALDGLKGNTFNGDGVLKPNPDNNKRCLRGIHINGLKPITLISNQFKNYGLTDIAPMTDNEPVGIKIINCSVRLVNHIFINIGKLSPVNVNAAASAIDIHNSREQNIRIWGGNATNVSCGIRARKRFGGLSILGFDITNSIAGMSFEQSLPNFLIVPSRVEISGCEISNYRDYGIGFNFHNTDIVDQFLLAGNNFIDNKADCPGGLMNFVNGRRAINVEVIASSRNIHASIHDNTITNFNKSGCGSNNCYGIVLQNCSDGNIFDNTFFDNNALTAPTSTKFRAIYLNLCDRNILSDNLIDGSNAAFNVASNDSEGIEVIESTGGTYTCNDLNNVKTGISFSGSGCDDSEISTNLFRNHVKGLLLSSDAIIGQQPAKENRWFGSAGQTEAKFENPGLGNDPIMSQFLINNSNQTSVFWANPRAVGSNTNDEDWFKFDLTSTPIDDNASINCTPIGGGPTTVDPDIRLSKADHSVVEGLFPAYRGFTATQWDARFRLYDQLARQSALLAPNGSPEKTFYDANSGGTTLGTLHSAWKKSVTFGVPTGSTANQMRQLSGEISDLLTQMSTIDETLSDGGISSQSATDLIAQRDALLTTYETKQSAMQNLTEQLTATEILAANSQLTILNSLAVTDSWEQNLKDVVSIILNMQANGTAPTENQQITLQNIASQCRYAGGFGVLLARSLYHSYDVNNLLTAVACAAIDEACSTERNSPTFQHFSTVVIASPNPADDFMRITVAGEIGRGTIFMTDLTGRVVYNTPVSGSTTNIPTAKIPNGLYYLVVRSENSIFQTVKVIITHH
jgi:hypothetical protein